MFRSTLRLVQPILARQQAHRGLATTTKESQIRASIQKITQSIDRETLAKFASELRPPTPAELPTAIRDLIKLFRERNWQNVTVRDAWRNTLVTTEVICWFFVGECLGKGTLIGYQV